MQLTEYDRKTCMDVYCGFLCLCCHMWTIAKFSFLCRSAEAIESELGNAIVIAKILAANSFYALSRLMHANVFLVFLLNFIQHAVSGHSF